MGKKYLSCSQYSILRQCNFKSDCICNKCEDYEYLDLSEDFEFPDLHYELMKEIKELLNESIDSSEDFEEYEDFTNEIVVKDLL